MVWLKQPVYAGKNAGFAVAILAVLAVAVAFMATQHWLIAVAGVPVTLAAITIIAICLWQPLIGFYIIIAASFFAFYPSRLLRANVPISTGIDLLFLFVFIGTIWQTKLFTSKNDLLRTSVSICLICYTLFFLVELFNPNMPSVAGWLLYIRKYATFILSYFIAYRLLDTKAKVKFFFGFWIVFAFITALYGCYQQWFGLTRFEMQQLLDNPIELKLLLQGGMLRKFSLLTDPVQFGILSGAMAVFTAIVALAQKSKKQVILLIIMVVIMLLGMLYSGTRTAIAIVPAGIVLYSLMTIYHKRTLIYLTVFVTLGLILFFAPIYSSPTLNRMRTVLDTKEASLNIRDVHRKYIQPYIYAHPIGGGVATSGADGLRFNPGHPLAGFPPDSGFLKYAIETGWIGLFLVVLLYLFAVCQGIVYYYRIRDKELKTYVLAIVVMLFAVIITQYAQVSVGQIPFVIFFYAVLSIMKRLLEFDIAQQKQVIINNPAQIRTN